MPPVASGRLGHLDLTLMVAALLGATAVASAQGAPAIQNASDVTFQLLADAPFQTDYQMQRVRRFLDGQGRIVQVREQLTLQGNCTVESPFKLEFVDMAGPASAFNSTGRAQWSEVYRNHAGLLHFHGGFGVHDPLAAAQNYRLFDFGQAQRIGRPVRRVVVFPNVLDKGIWVLDVDTQTGIPIYTAEYDSHLRLISELETTACTFSGPALSRTGTSAKVGWNWKPRMRVSRYPTLSLAVAALHAQSAIQSAIQPAVGGVVAEYVQNLVQVTEDPVNGDQTLVLGYTDGIDEFFVLQSEGGGNPFLNSPSINPTGKPPAHVIASYDDPALRAYVFHENGITFRVVGRGSLVRLKDVSFRLCQQAVTGV